MVNSTVEIHISFFRCAHPFPKSFQEDTLSNSFGISFLLRSKGRKVLCFQLSILNLFPVQTSPGKGGAYLYDIHFWLGKDTSQVLILFLFVFIAYFLGICFGT